MSVGTAGQVPAAGLGPPLHGAALLERYEAARPSAQATLLAVDLLSGGSTVTEAVTAVCELLARAPGVEISTAAMNALSPEDETGWVVLGGRTWVREWHNPGAACSCIPDGPDDPRTLSLPWISRGMRSDAIVVVPDASLMTGLGEVDRCELAAFNVRAAVLGGVLTNGVLYGSLSVTSSRPCAWADSLVADMRLLSSTLASRMATERAEQSLAGALARGDQARASQQLFFSSLGHELRTPITAILGTGDVIGMGASLLNDAAAAGEVDAATVAEHAATLTDDVAVVLSAGEQLLAVVEELLATGHALRAGTHVDAVNVSVAVTDVMHWLAAPAQEREVTVTTSVLPDIDVLASESGMRQILTNLVGNAIAYNRPGGTVAIDAIPVDGDGGERRVRITVTDTGRGLTAEQQATVFDPFVRFAEADVPGTGLGLSLTRSIAERDGGLMGVESEPGVGSVFWVDLPAAP